MTDADGVEEVRATFEEQFGVAPAATAVAPGRVNLIGGHVDYNHGIVLPAAIDRFTIAAVRPRDDDRISVHSVTVDETVEGSIGEDREGWDAYVVGTATVLSEDVDRMAGADLVIGGDMVMGAGLSSSASLEMAVAGALNAVHDLGLSREELADVGWRAENREVGMACGIMDQFASALGRADHVLRIDCRSRNVEQIPFDNASAKLLVIDTNVSHQLTESGFNDRVQECHDATARLDALLGKRVRTLRDVTPEEVTAHVDDLESPLERRGRHVTTEIARVRAAADALSAGDIDEVGSLMCEAHRSLRDDYEVSCAELNAVADILADRPGVRGYRIVGAGWGGSVVALVDPDEIATVAADVEREYRERTGIEADTYAFETADGLRIVG
ncbi:MAG: galactokinase [Halobacteriales archaeon]